MPRFLVVVEYDGTDFRGSQVQATGRTVQGELQTAASTLAGSEVACVLAGRTDSGVHASAQVASFDLVREIVAERLERALNGLLPRDVSVREVAVAPDEFHPRFWARARRYRYVILNRRARSALRDRYVWHCAELLDAEAMQRAGSALLGRRDFRAFGKPPQGGNTCRTISRLDVQRRGETVTVAVEADAFLRRMVRLLVGALVDVGRGKLEAARLGRLVAEDGRSPSPALPAKGLTLEAVAYERERLGRGIGLWWSSDPLEPPIDVTTP